MSSSRIRLVALGLFSLLAFLLQGNFPVLVLYAIAGTCLFLWPLKSRSEPVSFAEMAYLGFLVLVLVHSFLSENPLRAFMEFYRYYFLYLLYFELRAVQGLVSRNFLSWICLGSAIFMGLGGLYQVFISSDPMPLSWGGHPGTSWVFKRSFGLFDNPNLFGSFLMMASVLSFAQWLRGGGKSQSLVFFFLFFSLILTQSRGAVLGFIVVLVCLFPFLKGYRKWLCVVLTLVLGGCSQFLGRIPSAATLDLGVNQRIELYEGVGRLIEAQGLWGAGPGSFYSYYAHYRTLGGYYPLHAHNHLLETISELGLIGGVLLLAFFGFLIWTRTRKPRENIWFLALIAGCITNSMTNQSFSLFAISWMAVLSAWILDGPIMDLKPSKRFWVAANFILLLGLMFLVFVHTQKHSLLHRPIDSSRLHEAYPFYLRSDPAFASEQIGRVLKLGSNEGLEQARLWCLEFVDALPVEAEFPYLLARIYQSLEEEDLAASMLHLALSRDPHSERYALALMQEYLRRGDLGHLEALGTRILNSNPMYRSINSWYDPIQALMLEAYYKHGELKKMQDFSKKLIWVDAEVGDLNESRFGLKK